MRVKNRKIDLIWIIPELIGIIVIIVAALIHIKSVPFPNEIGLMDYYKNSYSNNFINWFYINILLK